MKLDAGLVQPRLDCFQTFERAGVDVVDGRALKHHVLEFGAIRNSLIDAVLQIACVGKVQAFVDAQPQHLRAREHGMAKHVAKVLRPGHKPDDSHVRPAAAVQMQHQR
ncbi:hypothetical protein SDC9_198747 [bioreactor metagenome]|uniref:Uncharacterized protein n=1 Tax=bioreactor metagenome TaxID=1076179 RepID=A0A645III7_9ZZZZ